jgi:hypothetical protein
MSTATAEKPTTKADAKKAGPSATGTVELNTGELIQVVQALELFRSHDEFRPMLEVIHMTVNDKGDKVTFRATDAYVAGRITAECDGTPNLTCGFVVNPADVKKLKYRASSGIGLTTQIRVGRTGKFNLSSTGNWTGRGVSLTCVERLAFGEVRDIDIYPDLDQHIDQTAMPVELPSFNPDTFGRMCKAASILGGAPMRFSTFNSKNVCAFYVNALDLRLDAASMPVQVS